ncbi:hypothetical protein D8842_01945 [Streptococcus mitis]|nr:hypothetical protein D8842_01945 [Streptococcus mitis]
MKRQVRYKIEPVPTIVELFKLMEEHQKEHPEYERYNFKYIEDGDAIGAIIDYNVEESVLKAEAEKEQDKA